MALDSRLSSLKDAIKEDWIALEVAENEEGLFVRVKDGFRFPNAGATSLNRKKDDSKTTIAAT